MTLEFKLRYKTDMVEAEVSGTFEPDSARVFFTRVLAFAQEQNIQKILVDAQALTGDVSTLERFNFGIFMAEQKLESKKIAFIAPTDVVWPDHFMEAVASNRGINVKVTTTRTEALKWLNSD